MLMRVRVRAAILQQSHQGRLASLSLSSAFSSSRPSSCPSPESATREAVKAKERRRGLGLPKGHDSASYRGQHQESHRVAASGLPPQIAAGQPFTVLGIESSCDDTGVAVVRSDGAVLSNVVRSQYSIHEKFGGVRACAGHVLCCLALSRLVSLLACTHE